MRVLAFGTFDARVHPRVGVLIEGLRAHGVEVRLVNRPLGLDTAARVDLLHRPWRLPLLALRIARCWAELAIRGRRTAREWSPDAVLVGYLGHFDVLLARRVFGATPIVLDHLIFAADTAADRGASGRGVQAVLRGLDRAAVRAADLVLLDTAEHARLLAELVPAVADRGLVTAVGAPAEWFAAADPGVHDRPGTAGSPGSPEPSDSLSVIFYGLFTPLQGATVIGEALGLLARHGATRPIRVTMAGRGQDLDAARAAAGAVEAAAEAVVEAAVTVTWLDWVDPAELPSLVAGHEVCLGILGTGSKARRVVPNKVFQGAAAGCAIITSDTAAQRAALGGAAEYVPAGDAAALADRLRALADDPARVADLRTRARARAREAFTAAAVTQPLVERLARHGSPDPHPSPDARPTTVIPTRSTSAPAARARRAPLPPLAPRAWLRHDLVSRWLDRLRPATVLELGCGQGGFGARLAARSRYLGVEPDETAAAVARARITPLGGSVLTGDQRAVPAGSTYDLVCAFEVLEHLEQDAAMVALWAGFVRPGGHLMLSVPAWPDRFGPMDTHAGHYRRYTPSGLTGLLVAAGLEPVATQVYGWPLGYALEAVRNPIDARKLARVEGLSNEELTASTGRTFQPPNRAVGAAVAVATTPFRYLQRLTTRHGTGLVALARKPTG
ncbi:MAG: methyltransferase domain-containing protein [Kineosporiaceae bacterium]|nr:methyltransferase domain-containing protein [Kineosporiaceae bacterium]